MSFTAEVIQGTIPATGTTMDLTFTGFGTPTAAIFIGTRDTSDSGSGTTETDPPDGHAVLSIGACDGTNERVVTTIGEDNVLVSDGYHWDKSGQVLRYLDGTGAVEMDLSFNSWITDGVRVNLDTLSGTATGFTCVLVKCDAAFVGTFDTSAGADDVTTSIGARVVFAFSAWDTLNDTAASAGHRIGYGWCGKQAGGTIQQMGSAQGATDGASGASQAWDNHFADTLIRQIWEAQLAGGTQITTMDADSVTFSQIGAGIAGSFLALDIGTTTETWQDEIDIPTANTNLQDFTQPGFLPKLVSMFGTRSNAAAWDSVVINANAGTHCLGIATGTAATAQKSHYIHVMDNRGLDPASTITGNTQTDSISFQGHHEGAYSLGDDTMHCDLDTLHSTGFKLQWISNPASVRHFGFFAIEDDPPAGGTIEPASISSAEAFGTAALTAIMNLTLASLPSAEAFGVPAFSLDITFPSIATAEAFGVAQFDLDIALPSITSLEALGTLALSTDLTFPAIGSDEAFGTLILSQGGVISPASIPPAEAFGVPQFDIDVTFPGITSAEGLGFPVISGGLLISPASIPTAEAFGVPQFDIDVTFPGIPSTEVVPSPSIDASLVFPSISGEEAFGTPSFVADHLLTLAGIGSGEAFGTASFTGGVDPVIGRNINVDVIVPLHASLDIECAQFLAGIDIILPGEDIT